MTNEPSPLVEIFLEKNESRLSKLHIYLHKEKDKELIELCENNVTTPFDYNNVVELKYKDFQSDITREQSSYNQQVKLQLKLLLEEYENKGKLFIIGNGGAGIAGLIAFVANKNLDYLFVWSADHSLPNFRFRRTLHAAITYEPNIEAYLSLKRTAGGEDVQPYIHTVNNIFENSFHLIIPPKEDYLNIKELIELIENNLTSLEDLSLTYTIKGQDKTTETVIHYRKVIGLAFFIRFFEDLYNVYEKNCENDCMQKWHQCFATRYNHSAMGENDKLIFILGAATFIDFINKGIHRKEIKKNTTISSILQRMTMQTFTQMLLFPFYKEDKYSLLLDRIIDLWESTSTVRNPSWFPTQVMDYSIVHNCYHCNDTAFLHEEVTLLKPGMVLSSKDDLSTQIANEQIDFLRDGVPVSFQKDKELEEEEDEDFKKREASKIFETLTEFTNYMRSLQPQYKYIRIKVKNKRKRISFSTLHYIEPGKIVGKMSNFAQMWSPDNVLDTTAKKIQKLFAEEEIAEFNKSKCKRMDVCIPFEPPLSLTIVENRYLQDMQIALERLGKYYLVEWVFGQYEAMDDFLAEIRFKKKQGKTEIKVNTCVNADKNTIPCFQEMTKKYFDKCYNTQKPEEPVKCSRAEHCVREILAFTRNSP